MFNYMQTIPLWTGVHPFADAEKDARAEITTFDQNVDGICRKTDVSEPTMTYFPTSGKAPHPAVVVCPGGAYTHLAWNHEGLDICAMLNAAGFTTFLLKYRCPDRRAAAHADAARAIRLIRANAAEYGVDPEKIGIIGFSAGAHLAATVSAPAKPVPYEPLDEADKQSFIPNYSALIYPAYLADEKTLQLKPEFKVTEKTPSCFLLQAENDGIFVQMSISWYLAMKRVDRPCEMHLYADGGHGYGILRTGNPVSCWGELACDWFRRQVGLK